MIGVPGRVGIGWHGWLAGWLGGGTCDDEKITGERD